MSLQGHVFFFSNQPPLILVFQWVQSDREVRRNLSRALEAPRFWFPVLRKGGYSSGAGDRLHPGAPESLWPAVRSWILLYLNDVYTVFICIHINICAYSTYYNQLIHLLMLITVFWPFVFVPLECLLLTEATQSKELKVVIWPNTVSYGYVYDAPMKAAVCTHPSLELMSRCWAVITAGHSRSKSHSVVWLCHGAEVLGSYCAKKSSKCIINLM